MAKREFEEQIREVLENVYKAGYEEGFSDGDANGYKDASAEKQGYTVGYQQGCEDTRKKYYTKADMVAMLTDIIKEATKERFRKQSISYETEFSYLDYNRIIQEKINDLKEIANDKI